jgi:ABC-2 type transport system permease protein
VPGVRAKRASEYIGERRRGRDHSWHRIDGCRGRPAGKPPPGVLNTSPQRLFIALALIAAMLLAGRSYYAVDAGVPLVSFTLALLFSTGSLLSLGFLIASIVPTARFAQPIGTLILYPMLGVSGLFVPVASLPPMLQAVARALPLTYAVSFLRGIWHGESWSAHVGDVTVLSVMFLASTAVSAKVFRWE